MRILVIGAGAVGGYFGGRLAQAGHEIFFIARGEHLKAINKNGLYVESPQGDFCVKPRASEHFEPIDGLDLIMVCVKHRDLKNILPIIKEQTGENSIVISLLNGVDSEEILTDVVPRRHVIGALAYIGSALSAPGRIRHTASGRITLGEMNGAVTRRLEGLKTAFQEAGIPCGITKKIRIELWEKLMWNVGFNGLSALTGRSAQKLLEHRPTGLIVRKLMEELVEVAGKLGIDVNQQLIEKQIDFTINSEGETLWKVFPLPTVASLPASPFHGASARCMKHTRLGGITPRCGSTELAEVKPRGIIKINGKIVSEGKRLGISTPYNETVWAAISLLDLAAQ